MIAEKYIWAYGLKNAVEHNGKIAIGSVIAGLFNHGLKKENIKKEILVIQKVLKKINSMN